MNRLSITLASALLMAGCAHTARAPAHVAAGEADGREPGIAAFSKNVPTGLPDQWEPMIIHRTKQQTQYRLVSEQNKTILHARAVGASSGLMQRVDINPNEQPWLDWQWKIGSLIETADNYERGAEDSPARIILGFDGDKDSLPFGDQLLFETARIVTGHDFPYATLMYIWENKAPIGTIIDSSRSKRIKMMVVASGPGGVGQWRTFSRNIVDDYQKAFGEKPGKLIGVGVLTDTDNTGETVEAWYSDIHLGQAHN